MGNKEMQEETRIMKKENKKLAQERRAKERKQKAVKSIVSKVCKIGIPTLVFVLFVGVIVLDPFGFFKKETTNEQSGTPTLSTDSSLEVKDGDTVNIDYVGKVDGVAFSGGSTGGAGTDLTIGSGNYIDDFEEQLIGAHPGDTVQVEVTFPKEYGNAELNGKDAVFEVVINGIYAYE